MYGSNNRYFTFLCLYKSDCFNSESTLYQRETLIDRFENKTKMFRDV